MVYAMHHRQLLLRITTTGVSVNLIAMFPLIVVICSLLFLKTKAEDDECAEIECMTVVGQRITCEDGANCSDGYPQTMSVDCYKMLVDFDTLR